MRILKTMGSYLIGFGAFVVAGVGCVISWGKLAEAMNDKALPNVAVTIFLVTCLLAALMMWGSWVLGRPQEGDYFKA